MIVVVIPIKVFTETVDLCVLFVYNASMKQLTPEEEQVWERLNEIYPVGHAKHCFKNFQEVMDYFGDDLKMTTVTMDTVGNIIEVNNNYED